MPYVQGVTSQGDSGQIEVIDVFNSPNVFANSVPIALWQPPAPSAILSFPELNLSPLSETQLESINRNPDNITEYEKSVGVTDGEVPQEGPLGYTASNTGLAAGDATPTSTSTTSTFNISTGTGVFYELARTLDTGLKEASSGSWKETGSNPRIVACYSSCGFNVSGDQTPWCAAFAGSTLKKAGAPSLKTLSSKAYNGYGQGRNINDPASWRLNDVIVFSRGQPSENTGHVGFFRGYNPANGSVLVLGGNQSDNLNETSFKKSPSMPVIYVGCGWEVPAEFDKPVTYSGSAGSSSVKVT